MLIELKVPLLPLVAKRFFSFADNSLNIMPLHSGSPRIVREIYLSFVREGFLIRISFEGWIEVRCVFDGRGTEINWWDLVKRYTSIFSLIKILSIWAPSRLVRLYWIEALHTRLIDFWACWFSKYLLTSLHILNEDLCN